MKKTALLLLFFLCALHVPASVGLKTMQAIYEEVKTPYKYGLVVAPQDAQHQIDCPMIYRVGDQWFMTYIVYNGSDGLNGRGYETWLATSDDLLHWHTLGRLLAYTDKGWDMNQKAGYPALIDWTWGGSYKMKSYGRRYWMSYFAGRDRLRGGTRSAQHRHCLYKRRHYQSPSLAYRPPPRTLLL